MEIVCVWGGGRIQEKVRCPPAGFKGEERWKVGGRQAGKVGWLESGKERKRQKKVKADREGHLTLMYLIVTVASSMDT